MASVKRCARASPAPAQTLRGLDWVEVRSIRGHVEDDQNKHFQVELRVGFKLEEQ